jgi:TPR repeat protein
MMRPFFSLILLCACLVVFSANAKSQEPFPQPDTPRRRLEALRLEAANRANPQAVLELAKALYHAKRRRNHREAFSLFEEASARGSAEATAWLGKCYVYGRGAGMKRDVARGVSLIQAAAQADDAAGLMFLGVLYERGSGIKRNYRKAVEHFSKAASKGYAPAYARLGHLYLRGRGVSRNIQTAFDLFNQGAQMGDPWSQLRLGQLAFNGFVGPQGEFLRQQSSTPNYEMALRLFSQAAAQGNRAAALKAAQLHEHQRGVQLRAAALNVAQMNEHKLSAAQDWKKLAKYYMQSARAGDPRAQLALGRLNEKARSKRGPLFSYAWYSLAIRQGNKLAKDYLDALRAKMTPDQVQQAEALLARMAARRFCYGCRSQNPVR